MNPDLEIVTHETRLLSHNALEAPRDYDVVLDGTDNFPARYLIDYAPVGATTKTSGGFVDS